MTLAHLRTNTRAELHRFLIRLGIDTRKKRRDRIVLEQVIFPELQRDTRIHSILFVGCAWYTLHYPAMFRKKDFRTMEIDPTQAQYGAAKHVVDSCEAIGSHFPRGELDCIILNGVFGFGLNTLEPFERTLQGIHDSLRPGGLFIFGWNELPSYVPFPPFASDRWEGFEPYRFPPLDSHIYSSDPINQHRFYFFLNRDHSTEP